MPRYVDFEIKRLPLTMAAALDDGTFAIAQSICRDNPFLTPKWFWVPHGGVQFLALHVTNWDAFLVMQAALQW